VVSFTKKSKDSTAEIKTQLIKIDSDLSKIDPLIRDEFGRNREENQRASKDNREELNTSFKLLSETLTKTVTDLSNAQKNQFETYIKIEFKKSPSYRYQHAVGLCKRMPHFTQEKDGDDLKNIIIYNKEQIIKYDQYFDFLLPEIVRLNFAKVFFKGVLVDRVLLTKLKWNHWQKRFFYRDRYSNEVPVGYYEEFFVRE